MNNLFFIKKNNKIDEHEGWDEVRKIEKNNPMQIEHTHFSAVLKHAERVSFIFWIC